MKFLITSTLASVFLVFSQAISLAWNSSGHMVVAAIAYKDLSGDEKVKVSELLKHHPDYQKWEQAYGWSGSEFDPNTYAFMQASVWPDQIRRKGNPYDHPEWHYIDFPLEPPTFPEKPSPTPKNDILYGISQSEAFMTNKLSSPEEQAVYLSWLIHLVGDIHQPLHCATLVDDDYPAPIGDKGGNNFYVRPSETAVNLHSIWDKALGATANPRLQSNYAIQISAVYPRTNLLELAAHRIPEGWSLESRKIAIESGYLNGTLKGSKEKDSAPSLPESYGGQLKQVAERQAALAGYRLADTINKLLQ